jgi:ABC-type glycerol-3-phosphate transport system substrate-binding protein
VDREDEALDFAMEDIVPVFAKMMLRYQGKLVSMPYDGDIHIMYWNKPASRAA